MDSRLWILEAIREVALCFIVCPSPSIVSTGVHCKFWCRRAAQKKARRVKFL
jgi:hypothetical protein